MSDMYWNQVRIKRPGLDWLMADQFSQIETPMVSGFNFSPQSNKMKSTLRIKMYVEMFVRKFEGVYNKGKTITLSTQSQLPIVITDEHAQTLFFLMGDERVLAV